MSKKVSTKLLTNKQEVCMTQPVKQNDKRVSTSHTDMLRMAATARMIRVKVSEIPPAKEKIVLT